MRSRRRLFTSEKQMFFFVDILSTMFSREEGREWNKNIALTPSMARKESSAIASACLDS
jgi:hypothetical protein